MENWFLKVTFNRANVENPKIIRNSIEATAQMILVTIFLLSTANI